MEKLLSKGAEASIVLKDGKIIKRREKKGYRQTELDRSLRSFRTRREAKILDKLSKANFPSPKLEFTDEKEVIIIEHLQGKMLKEVLNEKNWERFAEEMGRKIALLHNQDIIHGDLTTSNMMVCEELFFIDFGLSFISLKDEDRAVDLHLLKEALESRHHKFAKGCFEGVLRSYEKNAKNSKAVLKRLEVVERRGRYRAKKGG